jgi:serine/threonine-protein kinase
MTAEIGRVLGGRYRLIAPIGMGASAQVYLADDVRLRRRVALKMLHDALAGDVEFLRRFRAEARAAAALSHPNVMAVYDWGDDGTAFIVTEYLAGGSLRALLDQGELLTPSQALAVGLEATRALDYAHRRGFVHRDIKPANLLFGEEQRLRIADFGLARALAEAAWTEPQGAIMGTARYASPELAKGEQLTGKADVYALALVMVEAVTGEVPFVADTTLGTLMARVDRQLEVPDALGPLQGILARAGHPDPEVRVDARTLAAGLLRAAKSLPKPTALKLAGALPPAGEVMVDADPTIHAPAGLPASASAPAAEADLTAEDLDLDPPHWVNQTAGTDTSTDTDADADVRPGVGAGPVLPLIDLREPEPVAVAVPVDATPAWVDLPAPAAELVDKIVLPDAGGTVGPDGSAAADVGEARSSVAVLSPPDELDVPADGGGDVDEPATSDAGADGGRRRRRWPWVLLVVAVLAGAGGAAAALAGRDPGSAGAPVTLPVPDLVGRTQAQAESVAEAAGWKVTTRAVRRDDTTKGEVLATRPAAGTRLDEGETLALTVSAGQTIVEVPTDLVGKTIEEANEALFFVGLGSSSDEQVYDEDAAAGVVLAVAEGTPAELEKGSTVALVLSKGPEPRVVPSGLRGSPEASATESLSALRLKTAVTRSFSDEVDEGVVISVLPREGATVPRDSTVTLEVSRGPNLVAVPSVASASSISEAVAILKRAGLVAGSISGPATGSPSGTSPGTGTMVRPGSTINIVLA